MEQTLVSRQDAAEALSIAVRGLDYLISQGKIPVRKLGKRTLITRAALERFARSPEMTKGVGQERRRHCLSRNSWSEPGRGLGAISAASGSAGAAKGNHLELGAAARLRPECGGIVQGMEARSMSRDFHTAMRVVEKAIEANPALLTELQETGKANGPDTSAAIDEGGIIPALEGFLTRYLVLPLKTALPLAVWTAATYMYERFDTFPYLSVLSPAKRCGKTRLAEAPGCIALNPILTTGISEAALFRLVDRGGCTLLLDEAEALKEKKNERSQAIVSILNAGYRQGAFVYRCVPPKHKLQPFSVFGPKVVIAIGTIPDTVFDRSIVIRMRRRKAGEEIGRFLSRQAKAESEPIRALLEKISQRRGQDVANVYENLPAVHDLSDRDEEIWQALFAVCADLAPERITELRQSAVALSKAEADADDSLAMKLLTDIGTILSDTGDTNIPSAELVAKLKDLEESPWGEPGREMTTNRLARMLRQFGVSTRTIRVGGKTPKGYIKSELFEAVSLYVGFESATSATTQQ